MNPQCPSCPTSRVVKNGLSRHGHQRYRCLACKATFGDVDRRLVDEDLKQSALRHYAEGVGLRATERLVGPSHNSIMRWVRQAVAGKALAKLDSAQIETIEADELWSYVSSKKQRFGSGGLLIALPREYSDGSWAIVTPEQPKRWARKFLAALISSTEVITTHATTPSSPKSSTSKPRRKPTLSKA